MPKISNSGGNICRSTWLQIGQSLAALGVFYSQLQSEPREYQHKYRDGQISEQDCAEMHSNAAENILFFFFSQLARQKGAQGEVVRVRR